ncbi:MAG TPA: ABC transporter ATP-binding protein [Clostridiales bacterium]|nr:MAG: ABC transporter ATP-binding protein [Clostridiales bacterium GWD2_32_59]HAN10725.1 ABC transporter ATP-binding protein [Clostridiales bacterium]
MIENKHKENCEKNCCGLCCTKIENIGVIYGRNTILRDVNIHIHCGELTALIGPNGAGKSTLLKALLGEIKHTGELKFLDAKGIHTGHPTIGYVPQSLNFDAGSPTSVLDLFMACRSSFPAWLYTPKKILKDVEESLERVKVAHLIKRRLGALSGGEMQRVLLALALDPVPDLLLLDEPVSGVDQNGMELFYKTVSDIREAYDLSIILVSHDFDIISRYADRVVLLNGTVLYSGSPSEVYKDESFSKTFGMRAGGA